MVNRRATHIIPDQSEIPDFATVAEERAFWDTHSLSEEAIDQAGPVPHADLPPVHPPSPVHERDTNERCGK